MSRIVIGLTGPTGAGKSLVARLAQAKGIQVIDCDLLARRSTEKGGCGLAAVVAEFGEDILNPDGTLNRKALAKKAFSNKENTERLNRTLLPIIAQLVKSEISKDLVLLDAPTLFESGIDGICTATVAVLSDKEIRLKRIIERDNLTITEANTRLNAGKTDEFYIERADKIIYNNGAKGEYEQNALAVLNDLFGG